MEIIKRTVKEAIKDLERSLEVESGCLTNQGWIIEVGGVSVQIEITKEGKSTGEIKTCLPHKASRFSKENAYLLASHVSNGCGQRGIAIPLIRAIEKQIGKMKSHLFTLECATQPTLYEQALLIAEEIGNKVLIPFPEVHSMLVQGKTKNQIIQHFKEAAHNG